MAPDPADSKALGDPASATALSFADPAATVTTSGGLGAADDTTATADQVPAKEDRARYEDLGPLRSGGMGDVHRVRDRALNRSLAMKIIRAPLNDRADARSRFVQEAQATAQLQHPAIVPVHDFGELDDGRLWFTMKEVRGRTLRQALVDARAQPALGWPLQLRRFVGVLLRASQGVAYAHERGVVHRDLKPENIMLGDHGEVLVMDWGLAKVAGSGPGPEPDPLDPDLVVTDRSQGDSEPTRLGTVAGTPAYMSPEQARGELDLVGPRSDVYALGAVLYEILSGTRPYRARHPAEVVELVRRGPPAPLRPPGAPESDPAFPGELVRLCEKAMARDPADRFADAGGFAAELESWLDGAHRRDRALDIVRRAEATRPAAEGLRAAAAAAAGEAEALLRAVSPLAAEESKFAGWSKRELAEQLTRSSELQEVEREQLLQAALAVAPDLPEAHAILVEEYLERHRVAETRRDDRLAARAEVLLRRHAEALPAAHPTRGVAAAYLVGDGALSLVTEPPGAEVVLHRYERRHHRLVEVPARSLGRTPLRETTLPMGSYLCVLGRRGHAPVRYPVRIGRGEHWDGVRPGGTEPHPVVLPRAADLGADDCYVPAGWFVAGGGTGSYPAPVRLWCDGFVLRRFPVTLRELLEFLDDLVDQGREDEALAHAPRQPSAQQGRPGELLFGRDDRGHFVLVPDAEGQVWDPEWPALLVDWFAATAYADWLARRTGAPWRLAAEFEWEKAARGVDGRTYPWGDGFDPTYCCMRDSHAGVPLPQVVESFPIDTSPYGVRGMGGNAQDWCADAYRRAGPELFPDGVVRIIPPDPHPAGRDTRVRRGGFFLGVTGLVSPAFRIDMLPTDGMASCGFRVARPFGTPGTG